MTKQPEALRLADLLESDGWPDASTELRRLHEIIGTYLEKDKEQEPVALKLGECWPENVMQMWDYYRKEIANGNTGSEPRDWFESLSEMRLVDTIPPKRKPLEGVIDVKPIGHHSLQLIFRSQTDITKFKAAHDIKENT